MRHENVERDCVHVRENKKVGLERSSVEECDVWLC